MLTARFFSGASLFTLLIVDIGCFTIKKGSNPGAYGSSYTNVGSNSYPGAPTGHFSPGAPSEGISTTSYHAVPQPGSSVPRPSGQRGPAPSAGFGSSGPVFTGYGGTSVRHNPAGSTQPGAAFQSGLHDANWAVAPPSLLSGGEELSTGTRGVVSSQPGNVSPPGPMYQAGELSQFEQSLEHGNSERETEEQGWLPPRGPVSMQQSAGQGFTSQPQPDSYIGGSWGPYPYYDFMFLTGQYPPGTVSHASSSFEQGLDDWQDVHYERYYAPNNPGPAQELETFTGDLAAPQSVKDPKMPVMAHRPASSHGRFRPPVRNPGKGAY